MFDSGLVARDFSRAASHYAQHAQLQSAIADMLIEQAAPYLKPQNLLLDIGAGSGEITQRWPCQTLALDAAFGMCQQASKKRIRSVNARAESLPIAAASIDAIASNVMLQWVDDKQQFFAEAARVLKPQGIVIVSGFVEGTLAELKQAFKDCGETTRASDFTTPMFHVKSLQDAGFYIISESCEIMRTQYDSVINLCGYLRAIGATNKRADRPRGLLTPRILKRVAAMYPTQNNIVQASWVVHMMVARKR
jgi:malonyl-CoA O-methyltransferase